MPPGIHVYLNNFLAISIEDTLYQKRVLPPESTASYDDSLGSQIQASKGSDTSTLFSAITSTSI